MSEPNEPQKEPVDPLNAPTQSLKLADLGIETEQKEAADDDQERKYHEAQRLGPQQWSIGLGAICQPGAAQPMADPKQRG